MTNTQSGRAAGLPFFSPFTGLSAQLALASLIFSLVFFGGAISSAYGQSPPQYELTWLGDGRPRDINEAGVVAFGYASAVYDHATGIRLDLDDPFYGATWIDLEDQVDETGQWIVYHCNGINESDQIIGTASHISGLEANRNFVLNDPLGPAPVFELIPKNVLDGSTYNVCINDVGEVAQGREINNLGVVAGGYSNGFPDGTIVLPDGTPETFEGDHFTGINDAGLVTGYREGINSGPPSGRRDGGPLLFHYLDPPELLVSGTATNYHGDVNNFGDVAFSESNRGFIYLAGSTGPVNLDQLIVAQTQQDYDDWINTPIFPTGINDAGQIIGQANVNGWQGFILTPIVAGPGISVSPISGLTTTESGGSDSFDVVLDALPTADVTIDISSSDTTEGTVDVSSLTFTPANWNTPQTVTVTGVDDAIEDGDVDYTILIAAATSTDPDYNGLDANDVSVTNQDDDSPPGGNSETYTSADTPLNIPDNDPGGVASNIVAGDHLISSLTVNVNITHPDSSQLEMYLIGPDGSPPVQLFNNGDNLVADFDGTSSLGMWTLEVYDTVDKKKGKLNSWSITIDY
jgi:hypothetical protein